MGSFKIALLIPALALGVSAQDVRYNFASDVNFSHYRTFKWVQIKGTDQLDQIADAQLKSALNDELSKKGLTKTDSDTADLLVGYQVALGQEKEITSYDSGYGYGAGWGRGWYGYGGGGGITTTTTSTITIGQLDLDLYDRADKKLIWRGTASKTLDTKAKPDKREKNLRKGIAKLLKNYPPPIKKG